MKSHSVLTLSMRRRRWLAPLLHVVMSLGALVFLFPLLWMLSTSLKSPSQTMMVPPQWLPSPAHWENYKTALQAIPFVTYLFNTLVVCVLSIAGMVAASSLVAYSFVRLEWPGRDVFFGLLLATMMVPFPVTMVPLYGLFKSFGWLGTLNPLWAPAFFGNAFNIFMLRQFFARVPRNLAEAMELEGASEFTIFRRIYLPLCKSALAVVALLHFNFAWNDFLGPLIYLTNKDTFTLSLGLQQFQQQQGGTQWHLLMAASVLTMLPMVVLFFFTQKTFLHGMTFLKDAE